MKKILAVLLCFALTFGLLACGGKNLSEYGSQFVGTYKHNGTIMEKFKSYGNSNVNLIDVTEILTLEGGGTGTFKMTVASAGEHYKVGDVVKEGTVRWMIDGDYITVTFSGFSYTKDYGQNTTNIVDSVATYEKKAGTLHDASSGTLRYTKIG